MNQFLNLVPFDLYELTLFQLIAKHRSFTKAAEIAGLTQSAMTRQIQGMEQSLGVQLLERTTRAVRLTSAGDYLLREAGRLLGDVDATLRHLTQEFAGARKEIRVGVSRTIGLAYLPGFFHANLHAHPEIACRVTNRPSAEILQSVEANEQDLGVLCPPRRLPKTLRVTHRFEDTFTLVASAQFSSELQKRPKWKARMEWLRAQSWLVIDEKTQTGQQLQAWMQREGWGIQPAMQLDDFDLIINLITLGMGISFVPIRALALYNQRRKIIRVETPAKFTRELVVVVRKHRKPAPHLDQFIENILF